MHGVATPSWYVVQTVPRLEASIDKKLRAKRFETFFPRIRQMAMVRGIRRPICGPLFPSYLFVQADFARQAAEMIVEEDGVVRILGRRQTEGYEAVPSAYVERRVPEIAIAMGYARSEIDQTLFIKDDRDPALRPRYVVNYAIGQELRIMGDASDVFPIMIGRFVCGTPYRVNVEIDLLGRKIIVPVEHGRIEGAVRAETGRLAESAEAFRQAKVNKRLYGRRAA